MVDADGFPEMKPEPELIPCTKFFQYLSPHFLHVLDEIWVCDVEGAGAVLDWADQDVLFEGGLTDIVENKDFVVFVEQWLSMIIVNVTEYATHFN